MQIRHTYSFEKNYYTRSIEFSDYLRTSFNYTQPISIYLLNETTSALKDANNETLAAAMPVWLHSVPAAVAGSVFNARAFRDLIFGSPANCNNDSCQNVCSARLSSVTCYLLDEHGIIVLDNQVANNCLASAANDQMRQTNEIWHGFLTSEQI